MIKEPDLQRQVLPGHRRAKEGQPRNDIAFPIVETPKQTAGLTLKAPERE